MEGREGAGFIISHAFVVLDGSGSMSETERASGKPKHRAVAEMVQKLIDTLHDDPQFDSTYLTVMCYDTRNYRDIRLEEYDVQTNTHYLSSDYDGWDPIIGHGQQTPIGDAMSFARECAESWIEQGDGLEKRRAVIYLLSDGMRTPGSDGHDPMHEKSLIEAYNGREPSKGRIRIATVGYYQGGADETEGRTLLEQLATNTGAYFESSDATKIVDYVKNTILQG